MKDKTRGLNDGYMEVYHKKEKVTNFKNPSANKTEEELELIVALAYSEEGQREQDYEFAEARERSLNLKTRTLIYEGITNDDIVKINGSFYSIIKTDTILRRQETLLDKISEKINSFIAKMDYETASYGMIKNPPNAWNYIVFSRDRLQRSDKSPNDFNRKYRIVLVHEDCVPEGDELALMKAMKEIPRLNLAKEDIIYDYAVNPKTKNVVEMAVLTFAETIKGYEVK